MLSILDLLQDGGIGVRKVTADEWASRCPGCGGEDRPGDPSDRFRVWPGGERGGNAWCRICGWKGDNIQYCRDFLGMDFQDACEHVGRDKEKHAPTPRQITAPSGPRVYEPVRLGLPPVIWQQHAAELVDWAHRQLLANAEQLAYLAGRGITEESVRRFHLGWCPGEHGKDIYRPRESWGLPTEMKDDGVTPKKLWIPRGLVIPVYAPAEGTANPVRLRIRRPKEHLREGDSKYIVVPGSTRHTLVTDPDARAFVIVEAELDAMLISQSVGNLAGGIALGSLAHKPDANTDQMLTKALAVLVALDFEPPTDADADPKKAAKLRRIYGWWNERYPRAERWPVPVGKDPGDAYMAGCDIGVWVTAGLPPVLRLKVADSATDGPLPVGGAVQGGARLEVPASMRSAAAALARHMATHGIVLRRGEAGGLLLPQGGAETPASALEEMIFLIPDDLAAWLKEQGCDEVTAAMLGADNG
ncbi:CHC2 zinc finger domain-containing protein [Humidesulfovibrio idahonensis]